MPDSKDNTLSADPEALFAEIERVHGPEIAALARREVAKPVPKTRRGRPKEFSNRNRNGHRNDPGSALRSGAVAHFGGRKPSVSMRDGREW